MARTDRLRADGGRRRQPKAPRATQPARRGASPPARPRDPVGRESRWERHEPPRPLRRGQGCHPQKRRDQRLTGDREDHDQSPNLQTAGTIHDHVARAGCEALGSFLAADMRDRFGASHARLAELIPFAARLALECIGNSDALYHNVEHTMLVTLAGHDIFKGRALLTASTPADYSHFIVACLTHDIGYVQS